MRSSGTFLQMIRAGIPGALLLASVALHACSRSAPSPISPSGPIANRAPTVLHLVRRDGVLSKCVGLLWFERAGRQPHCGVHDLQFGADRRGEGDDPRRS